MAVLLRQILQPSPVGAANFEHIESAFGRQLGEFGGMHQLACPSENAVYVAELLNWRVQKLILQPEARTTSSR